MIATLAIVICTLLGLCIGSMLNVCIDRIPAGKSIVKPPSHCDSCNQRLRAIDLIPLFSYILAKGRCRYCGNKIPIRIPIVEFITASLFALITWNFLHQHGDLSFHLVMPLIYACIFMIIFFIDLEQQDIYIPVIYIGVALALIFSPFWPGFGEYWPQSAIANVYFGGVASALLGGITGFIFMVLPYLAAKAYYGAKGLEGMGQGDIYLAVLIGLATGFPLVLVALIIGILIGGVAAISLWLLRKKKGKDAIPFGPFLCLGAMITLLWGSQIIRWCTNSSLQT
jgi:leader peptidase (prepilin peptidase)/N-methyltransferase